MAYYLGLDIGTSGTKALIMDARGRVKATATAVHGISAPKPGWSEQPPDEWYAACVKATRAVIRKAGVGARTHRHTDRVIILVPQVGCALLLSNIIT